MTKRYIATCMSLVLSAACVLASGIHYEEISLEGVVTNSTFILQAKYIGEAKDDYGPHSQYILQKVLHSSTTSTNVNLKVWAAHAEVWGMAMAIAAETGESNWFTVPEYKGKGREGKPEKGRSYILLLKQLSRDTDFAFYAEGALLNTNMLQDITVLIRKNQKIEQSDGETTSKPAPSAASEASHP